MNQNFKLMHKHIACKRLFIKTINHVTNYGKQNWDFNNKHPKESKFCNKKVVEWLIESKK